MSDNPPPDKPEPRTDPPGKVVTGGHGEERAALLLKSLPGDLADAVLQRMVPENATRLRQRMESAPAAGSPEALQVLHTFVERVHTLIPPGGEPARDEFVASPEARALRDAISTAPVAPSKELAAAAEDDEAEAAFDGDPVQLLKELGAARVAAVLRNERTPVVVAALSSLPNADASEVLKRLAPERRREATLRLARGGPADQGLVRAVAGAVVKRGKLLSDDPSALEEDGAARKMAELLRGLERDDRKEVLDNLATTDAALAEKVKALLYVFEDLMRIEDRSVQVLLAEVEMKTLALSMTGADESMMTKVMNNLSQRARDTLTEEMGLLGKPRATAIRDARGQVVAVIQRLDSEGKLVMIELE